MPQVDLRRKPRTPGQRFGDVTVRRIRRADQDLIGFYPSEPYPEDAREPIILDEAELEGALRFLKNHDAMPG